MRSARRRAVLAAGLAHRTPYALRHTYATFAIAAGVSLFELARFIGTSVEQIDSTYGHLLPDSLERTRTALDAFTARADAAFVPGVPPVTRPDSCPSERRKPRAYGGFLVVGAPGFEPWTSSPPDSSSAPRRQVRLGGRKWLRSAGFRLSRYRYTAFLHEWVS
jgi:hypothetical protein